MITITLEGNTWEDLLQEISIIQNAVKRSRIEAKPDKGIVAPDEREGQYRLLGKLSEVLQGYDLGPEEKAEILERMRQ
jgi:hypothetical protein